MRNYHTQMEAARRGILTPELETVAGKEGIDPSGADAQGCLRQCGYPGRNIRHRSLSAEGIGEGLRTKINVNLGISGDCKDYAVEMQKVDLAIRFGAEAIYGSEQLWQDQYLPAGADSPFARHDSGQCRCMTPSVYRKRIFWRFTAEDFLRVVRAL